MLLHFCESVADPPLGIAGMPGMTAYHLRHALCIVS